VGHVSVRHLLIALETREQRDELIGFLEQRAIQPRVRGEKRLTIDNVDHASPGLATIVAAAEEWRCRARVGEVMLELGSTRTILRTET
jgi:hypothetical protein